MTDYSKIFVNLPAGGTAPLNEFAYDCLHSYREADTDLSAAATSERLYELFDWVCQRDGSRSELEGAMRALDAAVRATPILLDHTIGLNSLRRAMGAASEALAKKDFGALFSGTPVRFVAITPARIMPITWRSLYGTSGPVHAGNFPDFVEWVANYSIHRDLIADDQLGALDIYPLRCGEVVASPRNVNGSQKSGQWPWGGKQNAKEWMEAMQAFAARVIPDLNETVAEAEAA
jgi:hypothetical protein